MSQGNPVEPARDYISFTETGISLGQLALGGVRRVHGR